VVIFYASDLVVLKVFLYSFNFIDEHVRGELRVAMLGALLVSFILLFMVLYSFDLVQGKFLCYKWNVPDLLEVCCFIKFGNLLSKRCYPGGRGTRIINFLLLLYRCGNRRLFFGSAFVLISLFLRIDAFYISQRISLDTRGKRFEFILLPRNVIVIDM
jgi:hypothetical protein